MVFPPEGGPTGPSLEGEPFVVPLAIPLVAGPSRDRRLEAWARDPARRGELTIGGYYVTDRLPLRSGRLRDRAIEALVTTALEDFHSETAFSH
jgi:hypothetical protein